MTTEPPEQPVAIVTGGAKRVGASIVWELAARGYSVAIHANRSLDEAEELVEKLAAEGHDALALGADLSDEEAAREMIGRAHRHFGRLDVLVNNAAIWTPTPLDEVTADDVRRFVDVNTVGPFVCCRQVGLIMREQAAGGVIINIGDWAVARPYPNYSAYFAAKGAIPTLTRMFAIELAPLVRVNAVLPGPVMLPEDISPAERDEAIAATLVQREGRPEHVALAVALLVENDFITGVCLPVDGGRTIAGS